MRERFQRFMTGRYGADNLSKFLLKFILVLWVLSMFIRSSLLYMLALLLMGYVYFRMFSKNISKRYQENQRFLKTKNQLLGKFRSKKSEMAQRKTHHIYRCPGCRQKIRVPRGKGRICITCPKCKIEFTKTS